MTSQKRNILVADDVSDNGLQPLRDAGFMVEKKTGLASAALRKSLVDSEGLVVRSETKVTAEIMDAARSLRVIGRAGVGVDNIDVAAATARGIVVMNAPDGNTITTAEHTIALLIALARNVPQANSSVKAARWDRKKFIGAELQGKTLGIIGLGRIGRAVAVRARAFGMKIVGHDPFIAPEQARDLEIDTTSLDEVFSCADFLTVHTPLTNETRGIVGPDTLGKMKKGARIINCARGGLVDEQALFEAIKSGAIAGAALDVFEKEPPPADHPLLALEEVIVTPRLGASTTEAQEGVAFTVAEQMPDDSKLLRCRLRAGWSLPAKIVFWCLLGIELLIVGLAASIWSWLWMLPLTMPIFGLFLEQEKRTLQRLIASLLQDVAKELGLKKLEPAGKSAAS